MGGEFPVKDEATQNRLALCREKLSKYDASRNSWMENGGKLWMECGGNIETNQHGFGGWRVVWFNPWQHQFEKTPLIALLNEIRAQYSLMQKAKEQAGKLANVATYALLDMLTKTAETLSLGLVPKFDLDKIRQRGEQYENQHYDTPLTSQTFFEFFEQAVESIVGENGRLLICIDDLDRCEGEVAYRLLESLKLYLNASNCVFVLGMDQDHLEQNLGSISTYKDKPRSAREYLDKMLQDRFVLPVPTNMKAYLESLLETRKIMEKHTALLLTTTQVILIDTLNDNLPHNPRKIKLFFSAWERYLGLITQQQELPGLNWQITIILTYLAVFEEPIYRSIEISPVYYNDELLRFIRTRANELAEYKGLELPPGLPLFPGTESSSSDLDSENQQQKSRNKDNDTLSYQCRNIFRIAYLIEQIGSIQATTIGRHLVDSRVLSIT